ncbi:MAG TPA: DUF2934 domain-containing protein [Gammaproteobacteria bacterium]|nr:DUF2934 domain-containing protein [Gammaproteobacteria bacterium]
MIKSKVSEDQRRQMIAEAAYFRAERRGFNGGDATTDWIEAEAEVNERVRQIESAHLLQCLEEGLATATKKLSSLKRKASSVASGARTELQRDVDKLSELREALRSGVKELRAQGEQAGQLARRQAEKVWDELSDVMQRLGSRTSH